MVQSKQYPLNRCGEAGERWLQYRPGVLTETGAIHWEYEIHRPPREETNNEVADSKAESNRLGAEGWVFVETIDYEDGGTKYRVFKQGAPPSGQHD